MKHSRWVGLGAAILVFIAAFQPWIEVPSKNILITGWHTAGTNFGKPVLLNLASSAVAAILFLVPTLIAKRVNIFFCSFNLAWALRNFVIISTCRAGECPDKKFGLYLLMIASIILMAAALLPDVKLKEEGSADPLPPA